MNNKSSVRSNLLNGLGMVALWKWCTSSDIRFITVHGVMGGASTGWRPLRWQLDPELLRQYLTILVEHYEFITPGEAIDMLEGSIPKRKNCAVFTIDDGYQNALTHAIPVLDEFGIKPLIFVVTGMVSNESLFWFDRLDLALQAARGSVDSVVLGQTVIQLKPGSHNSYANSCREIIQRSRELFQDEDDRLAAVESVIASLYESSGTTENITDDVRKWVDTLSLEQMKQCIDAGAMIGSHTVSHLRLPFADEERVLSEMQNSKAALETWLGQECRTFCYPEGGINQSIARIAREVGYTAAFAVSSEGRISNRDIMTLHRVHLPRSASEADLLSVVCGLSETLYYFKHRTLEFWRRKRDVFFGGSKVASG